MARGDRRAGKDGEALWELKPLERRCAREATAVDGSPKTEPEEVADVGPQVCFGGPFFGGCMLCVLGDDEFVHARPVQRLRRNWELNGVNFCDYREQDCGEKLDEYFEEVKETASIGDDDSEASGDEFGEAAPPPWRRELRRRGRADGQDDLLHSELEAVMRGAGGVFESRGWDLRRVSSGRYSLDRRTIKLFLLPPGVPLPYFTHLHKAFDYDVAERAARITVCDGSLCQPLLDYLLHTGENESYDQRGTENIAGVSGAARFLDWNTAGTDDRILEMRSATMQANVRRSAAGEGERISALQSEGSKLLSRGLYNSALGMHGLAPQAPPPRAI